MASRYKKTNILYNSSEYYSFLRKERSIKGARQYATPVMRHPTVADRARLITKTHVWRYGDRYYKLAAEAYGDPTYWWVIAWYNGAPTEALLNTGDVLTIPLDLKEALAVLGVS
tara:strand:+ start:2384 stop:2725 length:342 start_codon:yes stop_codon:yes gene_type:complete